MGNCWPSPGMTDMQIDHWCEQFFRQGFGTVFERLVGNYGCPLVNNLSDNGDNLTTIFYDLDYLLEEQFSNENSDSSDHGITSRRKLQTEQASESLRLSIRSFAVCWLPTILDINSTTGDGEQWSELFRTSWRATRRHMLKAINQISYQSIFALYLFGQTPIPIGISEDERLDGLSGMMCIHAALKNIQQLRSRLRSRAFDSSAERFVTGPQPNTRHLTLTSTYIELENRVFWAAVAWDTEHSLICNVRSSLSTGIRGACREPAWILARGFLRDSFQPDSEKWRKEDFEITEDIAKRIVSATGVCRLYVWRTIASLKEALIEGVDEDSVQHGSGAVLDGLKTFKHTIQPTLSNCEKWLQYLSQETRLAWFGAVLHYYLGILIIVDALDTAARVDLLEQYSDYGMSAERELFNTLKFGLENQYCISCPEKELDVFQVSSEQTSTTTKASLIAIDPYPHYILASVRLLDIAISHKRLRGDLSESAYANLRATLNSALQQLPQSSMEVSLAKKNFHQSILDPGLNRATSW
ncbi:unnamed protein product [Clonostachys byssicola]|uniref:Transcription factor domain-containing protein n=1 Tax=Clonostachys byssicola TaxID=160290 RepID=A0A9N9UL10_9HYPO|nr:unnamed protein product [Clonostachys byssicola]